MKKYLLFISVAAISFACVPNETPEETKPGEDTQRSIALSAERLDFASGSGETKSIDITTDGDWSISGYTEGVQDWLLIDALSGDGNATVQLSSIELNPYDTKRMAVLVFTAGNASASLLVQQYPDPERTVSLSVDRVEFGGPADEQQTVSVVTTKAWTLEGYTDEIKSWLEVTPAKGDAGSEVTLKTLDINEDNQNREVSLCFRIDRVNATWLTVTQAPGLELSVDNDKIHLDCEAGSKGTLSIHCNSKTKDWRIESAASPDWLTLSKTSGRGDASVDFTASTRNDGLVREASFTLVLDEAHSVPFTVEQGSSLEIHVTPSELVFPALVPGQKEVSVTVSVDNVQWTLQGYTAQVKEWLSVDTESFTGEETTVKITTLDTNMQTVDRTATLRFAITDELYADLTITQEAVKIVDKVIEVTVNDGNSHPDINAFDQPWFSVDRKAVDTGDIIPGTSQKGTVVEFTDGGITYQLWATNGYGQNKVGGKAIDIWFNYYELNKSVGGKKYDCGSPNGYAWIRFPEFNGMLYKIDFMVMSPSKGPFCLAKSVNPDTGEAVEVIETVETTKPSAFDTVTFNLENQQPNTAYYICMGDGYSYRVRSWKLYYKAYE